MGATRTGAPGPLSVETHLKRWLAYLLAVCWPGAGHCVHRQWTRACSWALLCGVAIVFLSGGTLLESGLAEPVVITAFRYEEVAFGDVAVPFTIVVLNALDLYLRTVFDVGQRARASRR